MPVFDESDVLKGEIPLSGIKTKPSQADLRHKSIIF
jgi:hypothetical protein